MRERHRLNHYIYQFCELKFATKFWAGQNSESGWIVAGIFECGLGRRSAGFGHNLVVRQWIPQLPRQLFSFDSPRYLSTRMVLKQHRPGCTTNLYRSLPAEMFLFLLYKQLDFDLVRLLQSRFFLNFHPRRLFLLRSLQIQNGTLSHCKIQYMYKTSWHGMNTMQTNYANLLVIGDRG